eukprot:g3967.t1
MGLLRVFTITGILLTVAVVLDLVPVYLPHPACHSRVHEVAVNERPSPLEGQYTVNTALQSVRKFLEGKIPGSESIAISPDGTAIFLADKFGWIHRGVLKIDNSELELSVDTKASKIRLPGRPLGLHAVSKDTLMVCDTTAGLVKVDFTSDSYSVITNRVQAAKRKPKIAFANDLDLSEDGVVYFSDSTDIPVDKGAGGFYSIVRTYFLNTMEGRATGRLLAHNLQSNKTTELLTGLWYANGVALSNDNSFVTVVETNGFRVHRYWIKGPKKGTRDLLISNLPGFPDGISRAPDGSFWIALVAPVPPFWSLLQTKLSRLIAAWITEYIPMPVGKWGYVVKVSPEGKVLNVLADKEGGFVSHISSTLEHNGHLFLGNLVGDYISVFDLSLLDSVRESKPEPKEEL